MPRVSYQRREAAGCVPGYILRVLQFHVSAGSARPGQALRWPRLCWKGAMRWPSPYPWKREVPYSTR